MADATPRRHPARARLEPRTHVDPRSSSVAGNRKDEPTPGSKTRLPSPPHDTSRKSVSPGDQLLLDHLPSTHEHAHYVLLSDFGRGGKPRPFEKGHNSLSNAPSLNKVVRHLKISCNGHRHQISLKPASAGLIAFDIDAGGEKLFDHLRALIGERHLVVCYETDRAKLDPEKTARKGAGYHIWIVADPDAIRLASTFDKSAAMPNPLNLNGDPVEFEIFSDHRFLRIPDAPAFARQLKRNQEEEPPGSLRMSTADPGEACEESRSAEQVDTAERLEARYRRTPISRARLRNILRELGIAEPDARGYTIGDASCVTESLLADLLRNNPDFHNSHRFNRQEGSWYRLCDDGVWDKDIDASEPSSLHASIARVTGLALQEDVQRNERTPAQRNRLRQMFLSRRNFENVDNLLRRYLGADSTFWNRNPYLLGTPYGVYDLRIAQIASQEEASAAHVCTRTAVAPSFEAEPIRLLDLLRRAFGGDEECIDCFQRFMGYSLSAGSSEQRFAFVHGESNSGKSALVKLLKVCLGAYAKTAEPRDLMASRSGQAHREVIARLNNARVVFMSEPAQGASWDSSTVNRLVDGGTLRANFMRRDSFEFKTIATLVCEGTFLPKPSNARDGIFRRIIVFPFEAAVPDDQTDRYFEEKLMREAPEALAWAMKGFAKWQARSLRELPTKIRQATGEYKANTSPNLVTQFLDKCLEQTHQEIDIVPTADVYDFFVEWVSGQPNMTEIRMNQRAFNARVRTHFGMESAVNRTFHSRRQKCWVGLRLKSDSSAPCSGSRNGRDKSAIDTPRQPMASTGASSVHTREREMVDGGLELQFAAYGEVPDEDPM